jgi:hypothetical protein
MPGLFIMRINTVPLYVIPVIFQSPLTTNLLNMRKQVQEDINLWEVWIEYDQLDPEHFGTLYVHGEVHSHQKYDPFLTKILHPSNAQLVLHMSSSSSGSIRTKEVFYSEPVKNLNQYTSIIVYAGEKLIARFKDIEILI